MVCPNCKHEGKIEVDFKVLDVEQSTSTFEEWDQRATLECNECGYKFVHED